MEIYIYVYIYVFKAYDKTLKLIMIYILTSLRNPFAFAFAFAVIRRHFLYENASRIFMMIFVMILIDSFSFLKET